MKVSAKKTTESVDYAYIHISAASMVEETYTERPIYSFVEVISVKLIILESFQSMLWKTCENFKKGISIVFNKVNKKGDHFEKGDLGSIWGYSRTIPQITTYNMHDNHFRPLI